MNDANLPEGIRRLIAGKPYRMDDMGMSGSRIMLFDDCVLKIVRDGDMLSLRRLPHRHGAGIGGASAMTQSLKYCKWG